MRKEKWLACSKNNCKLPAFGHSFLIGGIGVGSGRLWDSCFVVLINLFYAWREEKKKSKN